MSEYDCIEKESESEYNACFVVPKKWIKVSPPKKMSDEARARAGERLKKAREAKGIGTPNQDT